MLTKEQVKKRQQEAADLFSKAGIFITDQEKANIEIADFGFGAESYENTGLGVLIYVNTDRVCAKELAMLPHQTCPEHWHPSVGTKLGKEETFRCRWGTMYLYIPGEATPEPKSKTPAGKEKYYTVWHEIELGPGQQYTLFPDTPHWFQAGDEGAVVSEFSTSSTDENDLFTDPNIKRITKIVE